MKRTAIPSASACRPRAKWAAASVRFLLAAADRALLRAHHPRRVCSSAISAAPIASWVAKPGW